MILILDEILQIFCSEGWNILLVWRCTGQLGEPEAAIRACKICKWGSFDDRGIQDPAWQGTLSSKSCCWTSWRELCFHSVWQVHFDFICGHREWPWLNLPLPNWIISIIDLLAITLSWWVLWQDPNAKVPLYWGITADGYVAFADDADLLKGACGKSLASFPQGKETSYLSSLWYSVYDKQTRAHILPWLRCSICQGASSPQQLVSLEATRIQKIRLQLSLLRRKRSGELNSWYVI